MFDRIKNWFKENGFIIIIVFTMVTIVFMSIDSRNIDTEDCYSKCDELGYEYFSSETSKFFGLKERDCKCKINNEIKDIL